MLFLIIHDLVATAQLRSNRLVTCKYFKIRKWTIEKKLKTHKKVEQHIYKG